VVVSSTSHVVRPRWKAAAIGVALASVAGCGTDKILLFASPADMGSDNVGGPDLVGSGGDDAGPPAAVHLGGDDALSCSASIAASLLRQAVCACDNLELVGSLWTWNMDSTLPPSDQSKALDASIGTNHAFLPFASFGVVGSVVSMENLKSAVPILGGTIWEALRVGGDVEVQGTINVYGDAWIDGDVTGDLNVPRGTLHLPVGATTSGKVNAAQIVHEKIANGPPPCGCDTARVPVDGMIADAGRANDNAANAFDPMIFTAGRTRARVDLGPGRFYVPNGLTTSRDVTLAIHGPVALYVAGPVTIGGAFNVALDPGASLDLLFSGNLSFGTGTFGDPAHPARVRLWSTDATQLLIANTITVGAAIWAPSAQLVVTAPPPHESPGLPLSGAVLVRAISLVQYGALLVTYDRALLSGGFAECGTTPTKPLQ
jgi:hypothetical protein